MNCTGHGLVIGNNGITIDCAGFSLYGDQSFGDYGINFAGYDNIVIENCNIYDYYYGL